MCAHSAHKYAVRSENPLVQKTMSFGQEKSGHPEDVRFSFKNLRLQAGGDHAVEHQRQHDKHRADPLRGLGELGVDTLGLALGQVGVRDAADGTGQALALAGLEQDDRDQNQRGDQLQNCNKNNHQVFPPTYLLPHGHKIHIVDLILPQRGADCKHKSRPAEEFAGIFPVGGIEFP